jgi:hypothetical protein
MTEAEEKQSPSAEKRFRGSNQSAWAVDHLDASGIDKYLRYSVHSGVMQKRA